MKHSGVYLSVTVAAILTILAACFVWLRFPIASLASTEFPPQSFAIHLTHAVQSDHAGSVYDWQSVHPPLYSVLYDIMHRTGAGKSLRYVCPRELGSRTGPCGGLSDRIRGIRMLLHLAAATGRRLEIDLSLIHI